MHSPAFGVAQEAVHLRLEVDAWQTAAEGDAVAIIQHIEEVWGKRRAMQGLSVFDNCAAGGREKPSAPPAAKALWHGMPSSLHSTDSSSTQVLTDFAGAGQVDHADALAVVLLVCVRGQRGRRGKSMRRLPCHKIASAAA